MAHYNGIDREKTSQEIADELDAAGHVSGPEETMCLAEAFHRIALLEAANAALEARVAALEAA
jgi:hypothetical protein